MTTYKTGPWTLEEERAAMRLLRSGHNDKAIARINGRMPCLVGLKLDMLVIHESPKPTITHPLNQADVDARILDYADDVARGRPIRHRPVELTPRDLRTGEFVKAEQVHKAHHSRT